MFITFEGPDGAGKSTQAEALAQTLRGRGRDVISVREPGGTELGAAVRGLLLSRSGPPIDPWAEALLFAASRAQLVREVIKPSLEHGAIVVADRFADSTFAYQGAGRGLDLDNLRALVRIAVGDVWPDLTFLLDVPTRLGLARVRRLMDVQDAGSAHQGGCPDAEGAEEAWNRFEEEARAFHVRVRRAYLELAAAEPSRWRVIDGTQPMTEVASDVWERVAAAL